MSNKFTKFLGNTVGLATGGMIAVFGAVHLIESSLLKLF